MELIGNLEKQSSTFIFLDTALPSAQNRYSYIFTSPEKVLKTENPDEVGEILTEIDNLRKRYWVAGYMAYESAGGLEQKTRHLFSSGEQMELLCFGVFSNPWIFDHLSGEWNKPLPAAPEHKLLDPVTPSGVTFSLSQPGYVSKIEKIKRYIESGDTYQVNFTFDVLVEQLEGSPFEMYLGLRQFQKVPFSAYYKTPSLSALSFSPELFFRTNRGKISVKPMKGTAPRGCFESQDRELKRALHNSPKDRSENIMIVDLLRNDLGRICITGSVHTSRLFEVETHRTVHQMTSTVEGRIARNSTPDLLRALFPCGSVTGAPKIRTMEIIDELETGTRGMYCGALGFFSPRGSGVFSVPIRTLQRKHNDRDWIYRVGSGIVWDSDERGEYEECRIKCRFLHQEQFSFDLFESMLYKDGKLLYQREHVQRLRKSARFLDFRYSPRDISATLLRIKEELLGENCCKVRIVLSADGEVRWDYEEILLLPNDTDAKLFLSQKRVDSSNRYLYHKTTPRPWYDEAVGKIRGGRCFDVIHLNERGEVTEGARSNLFVLKEGLLRTPPVECGLLNGVLRKKMVEKNRCSEQVLYQEDLINADALYCGNSVRGLVRVHLCLDATV
ncbi:Para-aminobenzoate synthase, aminase component [Chitinispirillum alkaliphilum]|nr:Para-aminobenzoate synthase, aminase component [Chitinispirillum alkaliphilum]